MENIKHKSTYEKCKYQVKLWEQQFKKEQGRMPSKLDIREADKKIRDAYKTYFNLKTAAIEESLQDVDIFSDEETLAAPLPDENQVDPVELPEKIWGDHLLKNETKKVENKSKVDEQLKSNFTEKLLKNTKPLKRYLRKSLSFHKRKSETKINDSKSLSQPNPVNIEDNFEVKESKDSVENNTCITQLTNTPKPFQTKSINIIQSILRDNYKQRESVDKNWLNRIIVPEDKQQINNENIDYNSDEIIDKSDDENLHINKKVKLTQSLNFSSVITQNDEDTKLSNNLIHQQSPSLNETSNTSLTLKITEEKCNKNANNLIKKRNLKSVSFKESSSEDYNKSSDDLSDIEEKKCKKVVKCKKKRIPKRDKADEKTTENENIYELEYSTKSRINSNPRIKDVKKLASAAVVVKQKLKLGKVPVETTSETIPTNYNDKESIDEKKLLRKIESGKLNENFVSLNLKKKIFVRGKKNHNFSKYKKSQWKNKKKELYGHVTSNCSSDRASCFTCGETGHWARKCPKKNGEQLLPLEADVEESVCPTLEEAAEMAKINVLTIRTPNIDCPKKNNDPEIEDHFSDDSFEEDLPIELLKEIDQLEKDIKETNAETYLDPNRTIKPYYDLEEGKIMETPEEVLEALSKFGFSEFRSGQEKAVMRILSGLSTLVTLSTGAGKSLCYQLPAYLYSKREPCITLVVSPLVSLMEDQVQGVPSFLKAACLHTGQTKTQKEKILTAIDSGSLDILLVSPEALVAGERSTGLGSLLRKLPPIAFACIDEVHCVSQWSHNFRPSYLMICRVLRDRFGIKTLLGLTATATKTTCESVIEHLKIPDGQNGVVSEVPLPKNLHLSVSRDANKDQALLHLLASEKFCEFKSVIVYCTRREECTRVATLLRTNLREPIKTGVKRKRYSDCAEAYHAGLSASRRKIIQKSFMNGDLRIVVATVAFGMGINKSDIRSVIHYNMPSSIESYVQEVGRAGRDGLPSHCHLFLNSECNDEFELRRHIFANTIDRHAIRKLLQKIFVPCSCKFLCTRHEVAFSVQETVQALDTPEENIATLLCYLELHENKYLEVLSQAYVTCRIVSYGGVNVFAHAAKDCIPLAMALALYKDRINGNVFEFPVVDVAAAIGWDSGICKHKLKGLEWTKVNNEPKRSKLSVEFSNLGFRVLAPGNLTNNSLDEALEHLCNRVQEQEKNALAQLNSVQKALSSIAVPSITSPPISDEPLKSAIFDYFENSANFNQFEERKAEVVDKDRIASDTRAIINSYRDVNFTGRAVARVFQGIQSPNYPAFEWGRCPFWRAHLRNDFNVLCEIATKEILRMKTGAYF